MTLKSSRLFRGARLLALAGICLLAPLHLWAQDEEELSLDYSEMSLEDLLNVEVTVASKSEETLADAPSSVTVFTRQEIMNLGVTNLEELLNYVPGFQTARTEETGTKTNTVAARGRRTVSSTNDVLFLIDGQRLNDSWTGGAVDVNNHISIANVKQVEIIRGPGSALYGSNAFLGVVNVVTDNELNEASVAIGNLDRREGYFSLAKETGGYKVALFGSAFADEGDYYDTMPEWFGLSRNTTDPIEGYSLYASLEGKGLRANLRFQERRQEDFAQFSGVTNGQNRSQERSGSFNIQYKFIDNDKGGLTGYAGYIENKTDFLAPFFPRGIGQEFGFMDSPDPAYGGTLLDSNQTIGGLDGVYSINEKNTLFVGTSWRKAEIDKVNLQNNFDFRDWLAGNTPAPVADGLIETPLGQAGSRDIFAVYLQDKWKITDTFTATVGVRYDDYSDFGDTTNFRGAFVWKAAEDTSLKLLYGQAFRAPSVREQSNGDFAFVGNPNVGPEEVETIEGVWIQKWGDRVQSTLIYYTSEITDIVTLVAVTGTGGFTTLTPQNVGTLDLSGVEFEMSAAIADGVLLKIAATNMIDSEEEPRQVADTTASVILNVKKGPWNWNLNGFYHSDKEQNLDVTLDSYTLANTTIRYSLTKDLNVGLRVQNLFDEEYATVTNSAQLFTGLPSRGRTYQAHLDLRF